MKNWWSALETLESSQTPCVLITVCGVEGSSPREVGAKMVFTPNDPPLGTIGGGNLEFQALRDAEEVLREGVAKNISYPLGPKTGQCCGGSVTLLFEPLNTGPTLYLFGAGHVGQAICRVLQDTPFTVHLIDEREEWIHHPKLPKGIRRHEVRWDYFIETANWKLNPLVLVMTHDHLQDEQIVEKVLQREFRFLGLIGSRTKWTRFQQRLKQRGLKEDSIDRVTCPIGSFVGGKTPQEIAISVCAQLLEVSHDPSPTHRPGRRKVFADGKPQGANALSQPALDGQPL